MMKSQARTSRPGFTLVEMLVATGLVVLMMLLFAQVFQTAAGLIGNQNGLAENDQNVRTLTTLFRGDIKQRTFIDVVPFYPGQDTENFDATFTTPEFDLAMRQGFFSISENNPDDPTDDTLHLTIRSDSPLLEDPRLPFYGKTRLLYQGTAPTDPNAYLTTHPDQPEFDDGQTTVNSTGASRYAEVVWFLRNGILYRRMFLIRDAYNRAGNTGPADEPRDNVGDEFIGTVYDPDNDTNTPDHFWRDFGYSAHWEPGTGGGLKFHSAPESLQNGSEQGAVPNLLGFPRSLGIPFLRFGSSVSRAQAGSPAVIYGPREFIVDSVDNQRKFIGRYTMQETADAEFGYPGRTNDPFNEGTGTLSMTGNGLVSPYDTDPLPIPNDQLERRGQDIVMSNVHEFDIQVWDDLIRDFVNLGHSRTSAAGVPGWFHQSRNDNRNFGSKVIGSMDGNSFDTWHPFDGDPGPGTGMPAPPYAPFGDNGNPPPSLQDQRDLRANSQEGNLGLGTAQEIALKAIRIKVRFFDEDSEQMRDLTFTFRLNRNNSRK